MSPPRPSSPATRRVVAALVPIALVALLGSAGCGADTADPPASSTTTGPVATDPPKTVAPTSSTTTAVIGGDEAEVRAVIDRYWDAWFVAAGNPPDPDNAELKAVLTGEAAIMIIGGIERRSNEGTYVRLPDGTLFSRRITSISFDGDGRATVEECVVDDSVLVDAATDEVIRSGLATIRFSSALIKYPDGWRMVSSETIEKTEGSAECDA